MWVRQTARFAGTQRLIWIPYTFERERVGGHSYQLMMVAWYVRDRYLPHLSLLRIFKYCLVHDTPEYLEGDTPVFEGIFGEFSHLPRAIDKTAREDKATRVLSRLWRRLFPDYIAALHEYEASGDEEKRLVYSLDKLLANVNVYLDDGYCDKRTRTTLDASIASKRHKIAEHELVLRLHDEIVAFIRSERPDLGYQNGEPPAAPRICPECRAAVMAELKQQQQTPA